ncbi:MAG: GAF domain-containing protein [Candidatus Bathyarchaeia archaeon]
MEDDSFYRYFFEREVKKTDPSIHIKTVSTAHDALKVFNSSFDCIVSDYKLPIMDGVELAKKVRSESDVGFIIYTGYGSEETISEAFAAGVDDYIKKDSDPSHIIILAKRIRQVVEKNRARNLNKKLIGAFENAEIKNFEKKLTSLHECATELCKANNIEEIAEKTLNYIKDVLGFGQSSFGIVDENKICFILRKGFITEGNFQLPLNGPGITVRSVKTGETQLVPDVREDEDYVPGPSTEHLTLLSEIAVPVKIEEKVIAVINAEHQKVGAFTENDKKLLEILAMNVSSSIQQLKSRNIEKMKCRRLEALLKHAIELEKSENLKEIADATINIIHNTLGLGVVSLSLVEEGFLKFISIEKHESTEFKLPLNGRGVTVRAVRTGVTQLVNDTRRDEDFIQDPDGLKFYLSELAVPIKVGSKVIGVLDVASERLNAFSEEDKNIIEIISVHIASALQSLRKLETLKKSEEKYRTILESALNAVFIIVDNKYVYSNKYAAKLLGFSDPSELIGVDALSLIPKEYHRIIKCRIERLQRGEALPKIDAKLLKRDGSEIDVELGSTFIDYEGKTAILSFVNDVSDRKRLEEKLNYQNNQLKRIVEEKTNELLDSEKMAAAGKITSMISHDLRSPLQTIKNSIYLLQKKPESQTELLSLMEKSADNAIEMLNEFRDNIKEIPPKKMKTNLSDVINEVIKGSFIPSNIKVITSIDEDLDFVMMDEIQIKRVIDNLVQNAIEAMKGYGELKINARKMPDKIILEIGDTGPGLSDEAKVNLFRPFYTTKRNGTGLGLYYCKRVVDAYKGSISVESRVGEGTIFRIELPIS